MWRFGVSIRHLHTILSIVVRLSLKSFHWKLYTPCALTLPYLWYLYLAISLTLILSLPFLRYEFIAVYRRNIQSSSRRSIPEVLREVSAHLFIEILSRSTYNIIILTNWLDVLVRITATNSPVFASGKTLSWIYRWANFLWFHFISFHLQSGWNCLTQHHSKRDLSVILTDTRAGPYMLSG